MDEVLEILAETAAGYCQLVLRAHELSLHERLEAFAAVLGQLYVAALDLDEPDRLEPAPDPGSPPEPEQWPGFGALDDYWTVAEPSEPDAAQPANLSDDLLLVYQGAFEGLAHLQAGDLDVAHRAWRDGFDLAWGDAAASALRVLHRGLQRFRYEARRNPRKELSIDEGTMVTIGGSAAPGPELAEAPRAVLGIRLEQAVVGVEVTAIHPLGPAAGILQLEDLLVSVDGQPLDGLSAEEAIQLLAGGIGDARAVEVYRDGESLWFELAPVDAADLQ